MDIKHKTEVIGKLCSCNEVCSDPNDYFIKLRNLGKELNKNENFIRLSNFGRALASIERFIILTALKNRDRCVCELEAILDKSQSTISHHLRKLERANLIKSWKKGNYTYYGLVKNQLRSYIELLEDELNFD
ncbi:MAG: ArsR/SmtB family transcription factor [Promethearchaeota archaeon]